MNADILNDLAARVEALEGQNRAIEYEIADAILGPMKPPYRRGYVQAYTASIDAAMTLLPNNGDVRWTLASYRAPKIVAVVGSFIEGSAATPALALTAAALRAHAAIAKENDR